MNDTKKKLYVYVDESGQDTKGLLFVVSILILEGEREAIQEMLEGLEGKSQKKNAKWNKARYDYRRQYVEEILKAKRLQKSLFFEIFGDTKKYIQLTSYATAKAILKKGGKDYKATVFIDGFKKQEIKIFTRGLRDLRVQTKKIRGVKKEENNAFIRLVDAVCVLVRDVQKKDIWAVKMLEKLKAEKIITEL